MMGTLTEGSGTDQDQGNKEEDSPQQAGENGKLVDNTLKDKDQQPDGITDKTTEFGSLPNGDAVKGKPSDCDSSHDTDQDIPTDPGLKQNNNLDFVNEEQNDKSQVETKETDDTPEVQVTPEGPNTQEGPALSDDVSSSLSPEPVELDKDDSVHEEEDIDSVEVHERNCKEDFGSSVDPSNLFLITESSVDGTLTRPNANEADVGSIEPDNIDGHLSKDISFENAAEDLSFQEDKFSNRSKSPQVDYISITEKDEDKKEITEDVIHPQVTATPNAAKTDDESVENSQDTKTEEFFVTLRAEDTGDDCVAVSKTEDDDILNSVLTTEEDKPATDISFTTEDTSEINLEQSEIIRNKISEQVNLILGDTGDVDIVNSQSKTEHRSTTMPEKQEERKGESPDLTKAYCRYRWAKNIPTLSDYVMFFCTVKMEEPVKLLWTDSSECFYSDEREVPCGVYQGNLVIDGRTYPVEDLTVKHYTFEVDLYVRDDVIDDEIESSLLREEDDIDKLRNRDVKANEGTQEITDPTPSTGIHFTGKYENLIRQQLSQSQRSMDTLDKNVDQVSKTDQSINGHESPVADAVSQMFMENAGDRGYFVQSDAVGETVERKSFSNSIMNNDTVKSSSNGVLEDNVVRSPTGSGSPSRQTPQELNGRDGYQSPLRSTEASQNRSGLNTPIANVINDVVLEQRTSQPSSHHSSARHTPQHSDSYDDILSQDKQTTPARSPVRSPMRSPENSGKGSPKVQDFVGDVLGQSTPVSGSARQTPSKQMSAHSSARQTPTQIADVLGSPANQDNPYMSPGSYNGSLNGGSPRPVGSYHGSAEEGHGSYQGSLHGSPAPGSYHGSPSPGSYHSSAHGSPAPGSYHGSIHGGSGAGSYHGSIHGSPAPGSYHGSAHGSPAPGSYHGSTHGSPAPGSHHGSTHGGSGAGSFHGSPAPGSQGPGSYAGSGGSRPQSLTSEQELSQYFEQNSRGSLGSESHRTPLSQSQQQPLTSLSPALSGGSADRITGASSLPVMTTQQRLSADISKRSMTPDNHIRVPGSPGPRASPLVTGAGSRASSRASTRTLTPTSANGYHANGLDDTQSKKIQELEDNVKNLRQLLSSRELEVHELTGKLNELTDQNQDLKDELADVSGNNQSLKSELLDLQEINQSLKGELDHVRSRLSPGVNRASFEELDRKYKQVQEEKEILASEVVKLRDKVEELELGIKSDSEKAESAGLSSYDPNNPYVLQRKIADLQSQVQDLQEANESAVAELSAVEKRCQKLEAENDKLHTAKNMNLTDLQAENRRLHDKISTLWEQGYGEGDRKLRVEFQQLKDDNRALKERNYKLHEENLAYLEQASKARKMNVDTARCDSPPYHKMDRMSLSDRVAPPKDKLLSTGEVTKSYRSGLGKSELFKSSLQDKVEERLSSSYDQDPDRYRTDRLKSSYDLKDERYLQNYNDKLDKDERYSRSGLEKEQRIKTLLTERKDDGYLLEKGERFRSSVDKDSENRFRSSLDKNTGSSVYKSSRDQDEQKYRYEQSEKLSRHDLERSKPGRSYVDRYDKEMLERSRSSENYRLRSDGVSSSGDTKNMRYNLQEQPNYHRSSDRSKSESVGHERSLKDTYSVEGQEIGSNREYKALAASYSELLRVAQKSSLGDKEWSHSEVDLRANRGRSKTPEPRRSGSVSSHFRSSSPPTVSAQSQHPYLHHPRASRHLPLPQNLIPRHSYKWDDDHHRRSGSALSEKSDSLINSGYLKSQHTDQTLASGSGYRPKEMYDGHGMDKDYDSLRKSSSHYHEDRGEDSDTATDILVNAQPFEKEAVDYRRPELHRRHHSARPRRRRDSLESESDSSPEDIDEQINMSARKRSKSADGRELLRRSFTGTPTRSNPTVPIKSTDRPSFSKTTPLSAGFRTVTPGVLPTQHNKTHLSASSSDNHSKVPESSTPKKSAPKALTLSSPSLEEKLTNAAEPPLFLDQDYLNLLKNAFGLDQLDRTNDSSLVSLTAGLRPFAPRTPADINLEDVVKFSRQGGKLSQGTVKYVGHLPGRSDVYLGVELDKEDGKHDGTFEKTRYFKCKPNKGVFVAFNKVVMAWAP